jgi:teichuronic acid biosynthesis glycosyltransferase TuaG
MTTPEISILMPSFNTASFVGASIASIQAQTRQDWELLIVDDASKDDSAQVIAWLAATDPRIRFVRLEKNSGAAEARNKALEMAQGRFIAFLDSDDLWLPNKLEVQIELMKKNGWALSFTAYEKINEQDELIGHVGVPSRVSYRGLLNTNIIGCLTAVYDSQILGKTPMPRIRKRQDFGLWLNLLKRTPYAYGIPQVLGKYRVRQESVSSNKGKAALFNWKLYREVEGLSFIVSSWYFSQYAVRGVLRSKFPRIARLFKVLH